MANSLITNEDTSMFAITPTRAQPARSTRHRRRRHDGHGRPAPPRRPRVRGQPARQQRHDQDRQRAVRQPPEQRAARRLRLPGRLLRLRRGRPRRARHLPGPPAHPARGHRPGPAHRHRLHRRGRQQRWWVRGRPRRFRDVLPRPQRHRAAPAAGRPRQAHRQRRRQPGCRREAQGVLGDRLRLPVAVLTETGTDLAVGERRPAWGARGCGAGVPQAGVEPATFRLGGGCSIR